ncbi:hypothetical protein BH24CHL4_BH24CHL4_11580 [soil metagenome]
MRATDRIGTCRLPTIAKLKLRNSAIVPSTALSSSRELDRAAVSHAVARLAGYIAVITLGVIVRVITLEQYTRHIDEPASLLAIKRVAEVGYPIFPSGVLYLQGAIFSYVAAPLAWFYDGTDLFQTTRVLYVCVALSVMPISMKLVHEVTDNSLVAIFVGVLVACDPNLVIWSVLIRPYGMLAAETVALLLLFTMLLKHGPDARFLRARVVHWIPVVAAIGTFTHIGFWLAFPPLALTAVFMWKHSLLGSHREILLSGAVSLLPLVAFLLLGRFAGTGSGTTDGALGSAFVGSHLFTTEHVFDFTDVRWGFWTSNFFEGSFFQLIPYLITLTSGVVVYAVLASPPVERNDWRMAAIGAVVVVHWVIICAVVFFVFDYPGPTYPHRYLNQVLPLGYILIGMATWCLWGIASRRHQVTSLIVKVGIVTAIIAPALVHVATAAEWRMSYRGGSADYWEATAWTAEHMEPGQLAITAMPPSAYFWFSDQQLEHTWFLAGPAGSLRTELYIKPDSTGEPGDYWLGAPPIDSAAQLCATLMEHAGNTWIIVDSGRLSDVWIFQGQMHTIIAGSSVARFRGHHGVLVLKVSPVDAWTPEARAECGA